MMRGLDHGVPNEGDTRPGPSTCHTRVGFRILRCPQSRASSSSSMHTEIQARCLATRSSPRARARHAPPSMCPAPAATPQSQSAHIRHKRESQWYICRPLSRATTRRARPSRIGSRAAAYRPSNPAVAMARAASATTAASAKVVMARPPAGPPRPEATTSSTARRKTRFQMFIREEKVRSWGR